jgi:hypothetical protein
VDAQPIIVDEDNNRWSASLIGYAPGPVVQIELGDGGNNVACARIFPPYHATDGDWLQALAPNRLAEAVLTHFVAGKLEVDRRQLLKHHRELAEMGMLVDFPAGVPLCVHPTKQA